MTKSSRRYDELQARVDRQDKINAFLIDQVAELNLRVRYLMETFKFKRESPIIGGVTVERTLYYLYTHGDRERFLARLNEQNPAPNGDGEASAEAGDGPSGASADVSADRLSLADVGVSEVRP